jgi:transcriptional regulator with XRE-family HTH domain
MATYALAMTTRPSRAAEFEDHLRRTREAPGYRPPTPEEIAEDEQHGPPDDPEDYAQISETAAWSVNQVVAYNLQRARRAAGLSQQVVAMMLSTNTNRKWSVATLSAAERSWASDRTKRFDANELVAFAKIFKVPVSYFLIPPHWDGEPEAHFIMGNAEDGDPAEYVDGSYPVLYAQDLLELIEPFRPSDDFILGMRHAMKVHADRDWSPSESTFKVNAAFSVHPTELARLLRLTAQAIDVSLRGGPEESQAEERATPEQLKEMNDLFESLEITEEKDKLAYINDLLRTGRR